MTSTSKMRYSIGIFLMMLFIGGNVLAQTPKQARIIKDAQEAKMKMSEKSDNVKQLFDNSVGYVIFPNVGKGGLILGGAAGNGVLFENGQLQGYSELRQVDVGLQLGGQAFSQAIIFQTQSELDNFKEGNYKLAGNASAVAMDKGRASNAEFNNGRAIITMPKGGAMLEISVGGQKFEYKDAE